MHKCEFPDEICRPFADESGQQAEDENAYLSHAAQPLLLVRGDESIWIAILPRLLMLLVRGPSQYEQSCRFERAAALHDFRAVEVHRLVKEGWILYPGADRRCDHEAPAGPERRREVRYPQSLRTA